MTIRTRTFRNTWLPIALLAIGCPATVALFVAAIRETRRTIRAQKG